LPQLGQVRWGSALIGLTALQWRPQPKAISYFRNIVVLEHVLSLPEPCRYSDLISYADLHGRGSQHVPLTHGRWFELPSLPIALEGHGLLR